MLCLFHTHKVRLLPVLPSLGAAYSGAAKPLGAESDRGVTWIHILILRTFTFSLYTPCVGRVDRVEEAVADQHHHQH